MTSYVMRNGKLVDKSIAGPKYYSNSATNVITDAMPHLMNHADGNYYDSKSNFRKATRANGCYELGNDVNTKQRQPIKLDPQKRKDDIRRAFYEVRNGIRRD